MTSEQVYRILDLALAKLIELDPATLRSHVPWLTRRHILGVQERLRQFGLGPGAQETQGLLTLLEDVKALLEDRIAQSHGL